MAAFSLKVPHTPEESDPFRTRFLVALGVLCLSAALSHWVTQDEPWLVLPELARTSVSLGLGLIITATMLFATRQLVRGASGQALLSSLQLETARRSGTMLTLYAAIAALGEEVLFRYVLLAWVGLGLSSVSFALVHRLRGNAGVLWAVWSGLLGLLLGISVQATGSLAGAVFAHLAINLLNARLLQRASPRAVRGAEGLLSLKPEKTAPVA